MSVMNGFDYEIKSLVFNNESHIIISDNFGYINDWHTVVQKLKSQAGVVSVDPVVEVQSLISLDDNMVPAVITGVSPTSKEYSNLKNSKFGIILSANYANRIASVGDKVLLITHQLRILFDQDPNYISLM